MRIKAMQTYYGFLQKEDSLLENALRELDKSVMQSYDLYISLYCLLLRLRDFATEKIEIRQKKLLPTHEDLNPNKKFINNKVFSKISSNPTIEKYYSNSSFNWEDNPELIKSLWSQIENSEYFMKYLNLESNSYSADKSVLRKIINESIIDNDSFDKILEDKNIYWNDDLEFLLGIIIKNINQTPEDANYLVIDDTFKTSEDEQFGKNLLKNTILNTISFDEIIKTFLQKWDLKRIAFLDRVILHLALCELLKMPDIPVKVAMNEYLDIARFYSTQKSNNFINGILDAVYIQHREAGTLNKRGKGLQ